MVYLLLGRNVPNTPFYLSIISIRKVTIYLNISTFLNISNGNNFNVKMLSVGFTNHWHRPAQIRDF